MFIFKPNTCLKCWSEQSIFHCEWLEHQSHSFYKFKASQLQKNDPSVTYFIENKEVEIKLDSQILVS